MIARLTFSLVFTALWSAHAGAAETWNCTDTLVLPVIPGVTGQTPGHVQVQIDGNDLEWIEPGITVLGKFYPGRTIYRKVVINNDVGIVAVSAVATDAPPQVYINGHYSPEGSAHAATIIPNPRVESDTFALDKRSGMYRTGRYGTVKVTDVYSGQCERDVTASPAGQSPPTP